MVSPGVVSISARFPDADGVNVSPGHQYGIIRNSLGVIKDNISPSSSPTLVSVADGLGILFYASPGYTVTDYLTFPGAFLTVDWSTAASPAGTASPAFSSIYWFAPLSATGANKSIISWSLRGDAVAYEISSKLSPDGVYSPIGYTTFNFFVDETVYTPAQLNSVEFQIAPLIWDSPLGSVQPLLTSPLIIPSTYQSSQSHCIISGTVLGLTGETKRVDYVRFVVLEPDTPQNVGTTFFTKYNEVEVTIDPSGTFAAPLVQGLVVLCEIPQTGYSKKFTVPAKPHANLSDISGIKIELYRAP